jgi:membrane-bound ClpP family serine protease
MNLRLIGLGGLLGTVVFLFSQLLLISWTGEAVFIEPNLGILILEILLLLGLMVFNSYLFVEELKREKTVSEREKLKI